MIAEDLAGNQTTRQEHLSKLKTPHAETSTPPAGAVAKGSPALPNELPRGMNTVPMMGASETHQVQKVTPSYPSPSEHMTLPRPNGNEGPHWIDEKQGDSAKTGANPPRQSNDLVQTSNVGPKTSTGPALQPAAATKNAALKTQMVNKTKISLDFQIENAAPTGVAHVDVWLSRDQGQTWQKHAEENGSKSPIEVQFPGDGVYGLILSPRSAATPSTPPTAADQADAVWLEVDATKPALQIKDIQSSHENGQAIVQIRWSAQDKNLAEGPVDLFYAATPQGPWLLIAKGLPAEGMHRWTPPAGIGAQTHLQLIARDAAGNTSVCGTLEPVTIAEPAHPRPSSAPSAPAARNWSRSTQPFSNPGERRGVGPTCYSANTRLRLRHGARLFAIPILNNRTILAKSPRNSLRTRPGRAIGLNAAAPPADPIVAITPITRMVAKGIFHESACSGSWAPQF